jgi:hypothetical protein
MHDPMAIGAEALEVLQFGSMRLKHVLAFAAERTGGPRRRIILTLWRNPTFNLVLILP